MKESPYQKFANMSPWEFFCYSFKMYYGRYPVVGVDLSAEQRSRLALCPKSGLLAAGKSLAEHIKQGTPLYKQTI